MTGGHRGVAGGREEVHRGLHALHLRALSAVPACTELGGSDGARFMPHLTVGQWAQGADRGASAIAALNAEWKPIAWTVDSVLVLTRPADEEPSAFRVRARIQLGAGEAPGLPDGAESRSPEEAGRAPDTTR